MNADFLKNLDLLIKRDNSFSRYSSSASNAEIRLANLVLDEKLTEIESTVDIFFVDAQETIASIRVGCYPFPPAMIKRIPIQIMRIQKKRLLANVAQQLKDIYGLDETFSTAAMQLSAEIRTAVELSKPLPSLSFAEDWPPHKLVLIKRAILLDLSRAWGKDHTDEPILWRISASLQTIAGCSFYAVAEAFSQVYLTAGVPQYAGQQNTLSSFFEGLNEDKAGNILDNLVLSQDTYRSMLDEGWKPDCWEIENLPMSIGMLLDYMSKCGFDRVSNIGDVLEITLRDATENYRYLGSPFQASDDLKKVKVTAPGWENEGELVVRPKVSEVLE